MIELLLILHEVEPGLMTLAVKLKSHDKTETEKLMALKLIEANQEEVQKMMLACGNGQSVEGPHSDAIAEGLLKKLRVSGRPDRAGEGQRQGDHPDTPTG